MSLKSRWFRDNARLQKCLVSDPAHVLTGDGGEHVRLIQGALITLEHAQISNSELHEHLYGKNTAAAVLEYKQKRKIINFSYQRTADNVVGKMTIRSLDTEMFVQERRSFRPLLAFGVNATTPKCAVIAQSHVLPNRWASQFVESYKPHVRKFLSPPNGPPEQQVALIKQALKFAGNRGLVLFSVGHGIPVQGFKNMGGFDIADHKKMRLGGQGSFGDAATFVDVFYDDKPPAGSGVKLSDKEFDERNHPAGSKRRLKNWGIYQDLCKAFVDARIAGVLLLTCNVGQQTGFLKKIAGQWKTHIIGYNEFTTYQGNFPGKTRKAPKRVRAIFTSDKDQENSRNPGSNIPFAEVMFPLSLTKMVHVAP